MPVTESVYVAVEPQSMYKNPVTQKKNDVDIKISNIDRTHKCKIEATMLFSRKMMGFLYSKWV